MGKVVQMEGWRNRKMTERREDRRTGKAGIAPAYETVIQIQELLARSHQCMAMLHLGRTVQERENAVINSMKYREDADNLAKQHGLRITKSEDGKYILAKIP